MRTFSIYEIIHRVWGGDVTEYVGRIEARNEKAALNKAAKRFRVDDGGVPERRRRPENFIAR
ncbi:hypothetical protein EI53_01231 [Fusobacterium naviforme]|nr:hypothetical protein F7P78_06155 [Fusobacterium naviforme]PSL10169.1 hypothetical protein EI53_01231 [Fusobacterium naviforme]STO27579.1 Uncharacterised protein [Fusobacterium naviforme]